MDRLIEEARALNVDWQDDLARAEQALYEMTCAAAAFEDQVIGPMQESIQAANENDDPDFKDHWYDLD